MISLHHALEQIGPASILGAPKLTVLHKYLKATENIPGDAAELGVYKGGTAQLLCLCLPEKKIHLFDTFTGLPKENEEVDVHKQGEFADTSFEAVEALLLDCKNVRFHVGFFPDTLTPAHRESTYSFVHIDLDLYEGTKDSLEFFYPRMAPGGVIILDDYLWPNCPGVKRALYEFLADKPEGFSVEQEFQAIIVKQ